MEEFVMNRRQGLKALGATLGAAALGTGLVSAANAAPNVLGASKGDPRKGSPTPYNLTVHNYSSDFENICLYQSDPKIGRGDILSLAWLSQPATPTTTLTFTWTIQYSFVWAETGVLKPGVTFQASQNWNADPTVLGVTSFGQQGNQIGLTYPPDEQAYSFDSVGTPGAEVGTLYITEDKTLPLDQAAVGIGMGGFGTYVVQSQPNQTIAFTPTPVYYLQAGTYTQGQVMGTGVVDGSVPVVFPPGVTEATATLDMSNTWSIKYGQ